MSVSARIYDDEPRFYYCEGVVPEGERTLATPVRVVLGSAWDRAAAQHRGAVEAWERIGKLAGWIERDRNEPDKVIAYSQEMTRLAVRHGGGR